VSDPIIRLFLWIVNMNFESLSFENLSKWFSFVRIARLMSKSKGEIQVKYRKQYAEIVRRQANLYYELSRQIHLKETLLSVADSLTRGLEWTEEQYLEQYRILMRAEEEFNKTL
jgi:hypothetical protein